MMVHTWTAGTGAFRMKKNAVLKYELLILLISAIWGTAFVAQQIGMQKGLGPLTFNTLRFALGAVSLIPVMAFRSRFLPGTGLALGGVPLKWSLAAGFSLFAAAGMQQIGLQYTSAANSGFITSLYVLFVPLLGLALRLRHEAPRSLWFGISICLAGFYLLSITEGLQVSKGDGLTLVCALLWAFQILVIDHIAGKGDPIWIACLEFSVCTLLSGCAAIAFETCDLSQVRAGAGAIAYAGIGSAGIAFTLQVICQKRCPPAPAAVIMSLEAVFAAITGYVILDQRLSMRGITGCGLILLGVLVVQCVPMLVRRPRRVP